MTKQSNPERLELSFKTEAEEVAWWEANQDVIVERLRERGQVVTPARKRPTKSISIRISCDDLKAAQEIGREKGIGYQTVLKQAIHKGVRKRKT